MKKIEVTRETVSSVIWLFNRLGFEAYGKELEDLWGIYHEKLGSLMDTAKYSGQPVKIDELHKRIKDRVVEYNTAYVNFVKTFTLYCGKISVAPPPEKIAVEETENGGAA